MAASTRAAACVAALLGILYVVVDADGGDPVHVTAAAPTEVPFPRPAARPAALASEAVKAGAVFGLRYVTADWLNIRAGSTTGAAVIGALPRASSVEVLGQEGKWLRIAAPGGREGWIHGDYTGRLPPAPPRVSTRAIAPPPATPAPGTSLGTDRAVIVETIIAESIRSYSGSCPCPYNVDRAGRRCGGRSAWSRAGGAAPLCFPSDVTEALIARHR